MPWFKCGSFRTHDSGVGGPVGFRLEQQLEVAEAALADQVPAPTAARRVLATDNRAIFYGPDRGAFRGAVVVVGRHEFGVSLVDRRTARPHVVAASWRANHPVRSTPLKVARIRSSRDRSLACAVHRRDDAPPHTNSG